MRVKWDGIPEAYWPDTEKPWRVTWGFGAFEDFATQQAAQARADELRADFKSGPFNAIAMACPYCAPDELCALHVNPPQSRAEYDADVYAHERMTGQHEE